MVGPKWILFALIANALIGNGRIKAIKAFVHNNLLSEIE